MILTKGAGPLGARHMMEAQERGLAGAGSNDRCFRRRGASRCLCLLPRTGSRKVAAWPLRLAVSDRLARVLPGHTDGVCRVTARSRPQSACGPLPAATADAIEGEVIALPVPVA